MSASNKLPPEVAFLLEAAGSAPSADNSQPWCFEWDGQTLTARVHRRGGFPEDYHATTLALGAATENLAWAIQSLGLDMASWFFGPPGADGAFAQGRVTKPSTIPAGNDVPLWKQRHTNRLPYRPEIDSEVADKLTTCRVGKVEVRVIAGAGIRQAADWVRQASEVRFQTREVNEWFAASLRYGDSPQDLVSGLHVDTLALPPGGVGLLKLMSDWGRLQWLNRLRAYKLFAAIEAANFRKAPLVVAIIGPADRAAAFDAGRCLQRVWLRVTELGLSAQPYYVVADLLNRLESNSVPTQCVTQSSVLQERIRAEYGHENTLHCLLRVGTPVGEIQVSGRLPLNEIMCT
ncbi:MAG: hypothetical protein Q8L39_17125 [Burkholderiales bacterium]|nr:hypothetical protein [Burkholderiales bacterium]